MINRYQLISILIKELGLDNSMRKLIANQSDTVLLQQCGYTCIRPGFYILKQ